MSVCVCVCVCVSVSVSMNEIPFIGHWRSHRSFDGSFSQTR